MKSPVFLVTAFCVALVLTLMGFMAPAAVLGEIIDAWGLSNTQAGWLGGALFGVDDLPPVVLLVLLSLDFVLVGHVPIEPSLHGPHGGVIREDNGPLIKHAL